MSTVEVLSLPPPRLQHNRVPHALGLVGSPVGLAVGQMIGGDVGVLDEWRGAVTNLSPPPLPTPSHLHSLTPYIAVLQFPTVAHPCSLLRQFYLSGIEVGEGTY